MTVNVSATIITHKRTRVKLGEKEFAASRKSTENYAHLVKWWDTALVYILEE